MENPIKAFETTLEVAVLTGAILGVKYFLIDLPTVQEIGKSYLDVPAPWGYLCRGAHTLYAGAVGALVCGGTAGMAIVLPAAIINTLRLESSDFYRTPKP